jgi:acetylornithine deacetylase/succinyl-diaminopimelate desuccinylase-like protein
MSLELTTYGPLRALHSGHYGNWAPNPIVSLAGLIARMRDEDGRILIPGFLDDVQPPTDADRRAIAAAPSPDSALRQDLALGRTEGSEPLALSIMRPALNLRGIRGGNVGATASNTIQPEATASIDFRLVPSETPDHVHALVESWLVSRGFFVVHDTPDAATRMAHANVVKLVWGSGYPPARTAIDSPLATRTAAAIAKALGQPPLRLPSLGGSIPMYLFQRDGRTPVVGVPIVNHDNNQHAANENLRLQNLWDGIEVFVALFGM